MEIKKILVCPKCKNTLTGVKIRDNRCGKCGFKYLKDKTIWKLLYTPGKKTTNSLQKYEKMHQHPFGRINDGSYEILAAFARGNKTVDIACGDGFIEKLAPETVACEFSLEALKKAKKNGAKNLVQANAEYLPFADKAFDLAICAGSLEHFENPLKALKEMARISKMQILTVHKQLPLPYSNQLRSLILNLKKINDQPIDNPLSDKELEKLLIKARMHTVFKGVWTYPYDFDFIGIKVPKFLKIPSCIFVITTSL